MSVKALTAARGGSNWKSLASGGPTVDESLLLTLGDGSPVGRNHSCPGHSCLPLIVPVGQISWKLEVQSLCMAGQAGKCLMGERGGRGMESSGV